MPGYKPYCTLFSDIQYSVFRMFFVRKDDGSIVNTAISAYIVLTDEETAAWKAVKGIILEGRTAELTESYQIEAE